MTDRINYLTVALDHDIRDDDIQPLIQAIKLLRGVLTVESNVADPSDWLAEERARREIGQKLLDVVYPKVKP